MFSRQIFLDSLSLSERVSRSYLHKSASMINLKDKVHIEKLRVNTIIGPDSWNQLNKQQCFVTISMHTDFSKASDNDDLNYSLNYAVISREVTDFINKTSNWGSLGKLSRGIADFALNKFKGIEELELEVNTNSAHIRSDDISVQVFKSRAIPDDSNNYDVLKISNLKMLTLIGVFTFERLQKQFITLDLTIPWPKTAQRHASYKSIIENVVKYVENANFKTVEALVEAVSKILASESYFKELQDTLIGVKVIKLNAITSTEGVGVSCIRSPIELVDKILPPLSIEDSSRNTSQSFDLPLFETSASTENNTAYVSFGSNVGDMLANIGSALELLSSTPQVKVTAVSSLFQSEPMYFKDQNPFLNGCIELQTQLTPRDLLKLCKDIEYKELKRVKHFDNGPRSIDLDIILYINGDGRDVLVNDKDLIIPHPKMLERTFVLEPLCEIVPPTHIHPITAEPIVDHLKEIYKMENDENEVWKLTPVPKHSNSEEERFLKFKSSTSVDTISKVSVRSSTSSTYVMAIVNTTPDSFSDGGDFFNDVEKQLFHVKELCNKVLKLSNNIVLDIGGCSTRPKSIQATEYEELRRTIPLIKAIRASSDIPQDKVFISIDTYRSEVAKHAISAGVDLINDVSGGSFDEAIFDVIAANPSVTYVLSHTRGDVSNMTKLTNYDESVNDVVEFINNEENSDDKTKFIRTIGRELASRYEVAMSKGVKRWQIIMDPGLGFAKNDVQNLSIIKQLPQLKNYSIITKNNNYVNFRNIPVLIGPSRKKFIGTITNDFEPKNRDFATGSIVASCVGFDANMIRVHNAEECVKSIKLADALYH